MTAQRFGDGHEGTVQHRLVCDRFQPASTMVATCGVADRVDPVPRAVLARHQTCATRRAIGRVRVGASEHHRFGGQPIDGGSFVIPTAHEPGISPAEIIDQKHDNIRTFGSHRCGQERSQQHQQETTHLVRPLRIAVRCGSAPAGGHSSRATADLAQAHRRWKTCRCRERPATSEPTSTTDKSELNPLRLRATV